MKPNRRPLSKNTNSGVISLKRGKRTITFKYLKIGQKVKWEQEACRNRLSE